MIRTFALLAVALALASCASTTDIMNSWIGKSDADLMAKWGAPDLESGTSSGKVLTYNSRNAYGQIVCRQNFVLDDRRRVVSTSHNCMM